jgi:TfoX/Sxy family transcriptional regulator of competence genes
MLFKQTGPPLFAMIMENSLYFAIDEETRKKYEQAGLGPSRRWDDGLFRLIRVTWEPRPYTFL